MLGALGQTRKQAIDSARARFGRRLLEVRDA
jgi:hypothetical protein